MDYNEYYQQSIFTEYPYQNSANTILYFIFVVCIIAKKIRLKNARKNKKKPHFVILML